MGGEGMGPRWTENKKKLFSRAVGAAVGGRGGRGEGRCSSMY